MKENNKFSIKKLLKTICIWIAICAVVGMTYNFVSSLEGAVMFQTLTEPAEYPESMMSYFENLNTAFEQSVQSTKEFRGDNFPAEGANFYMYAVAWPSYQMVRTFTFSLVAGIIIGTLVYILMVQKASKMKAVLEVGIAFILIGAFVGLGYLSNNLVLKMALGGNVTLENPLMFADYTITQWINLYVLLAVVLYVFNIVKQKITVIKLNKELKKQ